MSFQIHVTLEEGGVVRRATFKTIFLKNFRKHLVNFSCFITIGFSNQAHVPAPFTSTYLKSKRKYVALRSRKTCLCNFASELATMSKKLHIDKVQYLV